MSGRTTKLILAASLALNVFVVGAAAGGAYMWSRSDAQRANRGLAVAARQLDQEQRKAFREALKAARIAARPDQDAARAARAELGRLLGQPTLDRAAIDAVLNATRMADMNVRGRVETAVVDFASGLGAEDRARLVEGLVGRSQMLRKAR